MTGSIVAWGAADGRRFTGCYADPHVGDTASCRLRERCGFVREGTVGDGDDEYAVYVLR